jgi:hypothetical protein
MYSAAETASRPDTWSVSGRRKSALWMQTTGERDDRDDSGSWITVPALGRERWCAAVAVLSCVCGPGLGQDHGTPALR